MLVCSVLMCVCFCLCVYVYPGLCAGYMIALHREVVRTERKEEGNQACRGEGGESKGEREKERKKGSLAYRHVLTREHLTTPVNTSDQHDV